MKSHRRILFIVPYPKGISPGQRFRFEQYLHLLKSTDYRISPFLSAKDYDIFFHTNILRKSWILMKGYLRRATLIFRLSKYDKLYIYRETSPAGPPLLMWLNRYIWKKPFVYDFDDAIWLRDRGGENALTASVKWKKKVRLLCSWASEVSVGNEYLANYARRHSSNVHVIPTVVDTQQYHKRTSQRDGKTIIGWTGSHSTIKYLEQILPVLRKLSQIHDFEFHVIANKNPEYGDDFMKFIPWEKSTEIEDLQKFHIGIMPLSDNEWSKGKCGFKAIQYLALETPAVVSPVGVNSEIVKNGESGFQASSDEEWLKWLEKLITDGDLRNRMGKAGRIHVEQNYSVKSTEKRFLGMLN